MRSLSVTLSPFFDGLPAFPVTARRYIVRASGSDPTSRAHVSLKEIHARCDWQKTFRGFFRLPFPFLMGGKKPCRNLLPVAPEGGSFLM